MNIRFVDRDGAVTQAEGREGERLLDTAQRAGQSLEGTCDGDMACATCHVLVDPVWWNRLPAASADEEDLLDLAYAATRYSRLACQVRLAAALDGFTVRIP